MVKHPAIHISSSNVLIDSPVEIRITDLPAYDVVTLKAKMRDNFGLDWVSHAKFKADAEGRIDLTRARPLSGTYSDPDVTGLFWSMQPVSSDTPKRRTPLKPLKSTFTLMRREEVLAVSSLTRNLVLPEVKRLPVREQGLVGTLFYHAKEKPLPTIIVLGGSEGGLREGNAALLASHGFNTLALAYFGMENLPNELANIPVDYIERAINWLGNHPNIDARSIGMMGTSKGGELALLCASMFSTIKAVVGYVPSSVVYPGISQKNINASSWSYKGEELPYAAGKIPAEVEDSLGENGGKITFRDWYLHLAKGETKAEIPVENIHGPVLFISGGEDQLWPSNILSDRAIERLKRNKHPFYYKHVTYPRAGHSFVTPGLPTTQSDETPFASGMKLLLGGNPQDIAAAQADAWQKARLFFEKYLFM